MTIAEVQKLVSDVGATCRVKYPHGVFVNPKTIAALQASCRALKRPESRSIVETFADLAVYPLEVVPEGELWPRAKNGEIDFDAFFLQQAGIAGSAE
jgi:hypothetical protein